MAAREQARQTLGFLAPDGTKAHKPEAQAKEAGCPSLALQACVRPADGSAGARAISGLDAGPFPPGFDLFRVEWERAAWAHAGDPNAEAAAKVSLLRWRLRRAASQPAR